MRATHCEGIAMSRSRAWGQAKLCLPPALPRRPRCGTVGYLILHLLTPSVWRETGTGDGGGAIRTPPGRALKHPPAEPLSQPLSRSSSPPRLRSALSLRPLATRADTRRSAFALSGPLLQSPPKPLCPLSLTVHFYPTLSLPHTTPTYPLTPVTPFPIILLPPPPQPPPPLSPFSLTFPSCHSTPPYHISHPHHPLPPSHTLSAHCAREKRHLLPPTGTSERRSLPLLLHEDRLCVHVRCRHRIEILLLCR